MYIKREMLNVMSNLFADHNLSRMPNSFDSFVPFLFFFFFSFFNGRHRRLITTKRQKWSLQKKQRKKKPFFSQKKKTRISLLPFLENHFHMKNILLAEYGRVEMLIEISKNYPIRFGSFSSNYL